MVIENRGLSTTWAVVAQWFIRCTTARKVVSLNPGPGKLLLSL